jgi:hypothetical protein
LSTKDGFVPALLRAVGVAERDRGEINAAVKSRVRAFISQIKRKKIFEELARSNALHERKLEGRLFGADEL